MLKQRLFKKESIVQSAGIVLILIILERIIQTGRGIVFARVLGPSEYGVFTLVFFFIPLVVSFAKLGIPSSYERYVPQYERKNNLVDFFKKSCFLTIIGGLFFTALLLLFAKQASELLYASSRYKNIIILGALTVTFYVLYEDLIYFFNGLRVFKVGALLKFTQFFIFTIFGIAAVVFFQKVEFIILANLVSFILVLSVFTFIICKYLLNLKHQKLKIHETNFYSKMFKYSIWFIVTPVIFTLFSYTDRWMLNRFLGLHEVGVYSVASNITGVILMFGIIAGNVLLPNLSKIWEQNQKNKVIFMLNFGTKISTLILLAGAVIIVLFKKQIISILYGAKYLEVLPVIGMLSVFWLFNSIFWTIKGYSGLVEKTYLPFIGLTVGLVLNVILNLILIPRYGIMGAAVATTIAFGINLIIMSVLNHREGMRIELKTILVYLSPLIVLFNNAVMVFTFLILIGIMFSTEFIISKGEKNLLYKQIRKGIGRQK